MALRNVGEYAFRPADLGIVRYTVKVDVNRVLADYPNVVAVMAAPMYSATGSRSCGGGLKPCTRQLDKAFGVDVAGAITNSGVTFSVVNGEAKALDRDGVVPGATVAVGLYPSLVRDRRNVGSRTRESSVAGLGILDDGSLLYIVGGGGTLFDLGALFVQRGAKVAGYTDAGSSAALYVRDEGWRGVHARAPKLPAWIIATKPSFYIPPGVRDAAVDVVTGVCAVSAGFLIGKAIFG